MDLGGLNWSLITIVGPVLLAVVLLWAVLKNRKARGGMDRTDRGTRDVYDRSEEVRRSGDDDGA